MKQIDKNKRRIGKNIKVKKRIVIGYIAIIIMMIISSLVTDTYLQISNQKQNHAYEHFGTSQGVVGMLGFQYQRECVLTRDIINSQSELQRSRYEKELRDTVLKTNQLRKNVEKYIDSPEEKKIWNDLVTNLNKDRELRSKAIGRVDGQKNTTIIQSELNENSRDITEQIAEGTEKLFKLLQSEGKQVLAETDRIAIVGTIVNLALLIIAVLVAVIISINVSRDISEPVNQMLNAVKEMAEGKINARVAYESKNELGQLVKAYNKSVDMIAEYITEIERGMASIAKGDFTVRFRMHFKGDFFKIQVAIHDTLKSLNKAFIAINQAADEVSDGADQVSSGAQVLSQGATEQASSVQQLAATINEIFNQVQQNADGSDDASQKVEILGAEITENNQQMQELIVAMSQISESSSEIGKIIKTIQDIAFQTNILALNAAVEAARAGAAGKGFAVVADEVRNLASKSAEAAKNTTALIEHSIKAVQNGTRIADGTAQSLLEIVKGSKEVVNTVTRISEASKEQAVSIAQVTQGIEQISNVVQTNSATAEESAAASEELSGQSQMLKNLVGKFKLDNKYYTIDTIINNQNLEEKDDDKAEQSMTFESGAAHDKY